MKKTFPMWVEGRKILLLEVLRKESIDAIQLWNLSEIEGSGANYKGIPFTEFAESVNRSKDGMLLPSDELMQIAGLLTDLNSISLSGQTVDGVQLEISAVDSTFWEVIKMPNNKDTCNSPSE